MDPVLEQLQEIARAVFDDPDLTLEDSTVAKDVAGWDSLGHVNFMFNVEEHFGVEFSEDEFGQATSVAALRGLLDDKLRSGRA